MECQHVATDKGKIVVSHQGVISCYIGRITLNIITVHVTRI